MKKYLTQKFPWVFIFPSVVTILVATILAVNGVSSSIEDLDKGANLNSIRFIQYLDGNVALQEIKAGNLDTYFYRIPLEQASAVFNDPHFKVYEKSGGSFGLLLNPAPSNNSQTLNPFQFRDIRFALNYLINRDFVAGEILRGYGNIQVDPFGISSPEYESILPEVESFGFRYNPNLASDIIDHTLERAGATKIGEKWLYHGSPISIKILIRSDDPTRQSMGELISSELEKLGFKVERDYGDLNKANNLIYGTDPQQFQWQIYTEAFGGTSAFVRYNPVVTSQMYAPYFGKMPGWQNPVFWNYKNASIDAVTQKIEFSNFTSQSEHDKLLRQAVRMGIQESVRIFVAQNIDPYVASSSIRGLINDFGAGITSRISLINAKSQTGILNVGVKQIYQGAWNGVAGCNDIYCTQILSLISDPATFRNPYTGEVIPLRTVWTNITTAGPKGHLVVDPDAIIWNVSSQKWMPVGHNMTSKSEVTFKLLYSNWQNSQPMTKADLIYAMYFPVEWGTKTGPNDTTFDPEFTSQAQVALPLLKGIKFLDDNTIVSYVDLWHFDKKEIADFASVWASTPWEIMAATERLVVDGKFAYSKSEAMVKDIDWLSLIIPSHAEAISQELKKMRSEGFIPAPLQGIITKEDAMRRYESSIDWITQHHHAVIGNGPFILTSYEPTARVISLSAFPDNTYPFKKDYWSKYEAPHVAMIDEIIPNTLPKIVHIGDPFSLVAKISTNRVPSDNIILRYFLSNKDGKLIVQGNGTQGNEEGKYLINLSENETKMLSYGPNQLEIFAHSNDALKSDVYTTTLIGLPR